MRVTRGVVLRGADVVDGTGAPARHADVAVVDGRIAVVGHVPHDDDLDEVDLGGLTLAPGFVDIHTHYDAQVFWEPALETSRTHGVTTVLTGNCGFTIAPARPTDRAAIIHMLEGVEGMSAAVLQAGIPWSFESFPEYLAALRALPLGVNVATLVGHSAVRLYVMGADASERVATDSERAQMAQLVREAVAAGAFGFSTSRAETHYDGAGRPVPSRAGDLAEIEELATAAARAGARVIEAAYGTDLTVDVLGRLAERTGANVTYGGILTGDVSRDEIAETLALVDRIDGVLRPQIIPMVLFHNVSCAVPLDLVKMSDAFREALPLDHAGQCALYRDPGWRARANAALTPRGIERLPTTTLSETTRHRELVGRTIPEIAAARGTGHLETLLDLALEEDLETRFQYVAHNFDDGAVAALLRDPRTVLGLGDAGAHHDRIYCANFPTYLLGHWVRDRGALELEHAIWRLTGQPAELLGLRDRGRVSVGFAADLVAFDPATIAHVAPTRVYDLPTGADRLVGESRGVEHVWVNGVDTRRHGVNVAAPAGVVLEEGRT